MRRITQVQLAVTVVAVAAIFYIRLTALPRASPFELFLLLNIFLAVLFRPPAALASIVGGLLAAHALMLIEGRSPSRFATMTIVYLVLSGILLLLNHRWHRAKDRAELDRAAHAQQRERLLAEAQHANKAKDRLLANVSHELRTPLNAILGWAAMMAREDARAEDVRRAAEVIKRNAQALAGVVDELLHVSLAAADRIQIEWMPVPVGITVKAAVESMQPEAATRHIKVDCAVPSEAGTILGDEQRLQQVLLIVLSNAIKFTQPTGEVSVGATTAGGFVTIEVRDTGIGIEADYLPMIFDRFSQADTSTTRTHGGIGLGLSIAKGLVEAMGGTITVASPGSGRGTTVAVRFPVQARSAHSTIQSTERAAQSS